MTNHILTVKYSLRGNTLAIQSLFILPSPMCVLYFTQKYQPYTFPELSTSPLTSLSSIYSQKPNFISLEKCHQMCSVITPSGIFPCSSFLITYTNYNISPPFIVSN